MSKDVRRLPEIELHDVGNATLRAAFWKAETPSGKPPILFFNGIGANIELVFKLGEFIRDRDLLAFDVPGIGGSPDVKLPYRPWQLAKWVRRLTLIYGFKTHDVMGVSWGGALAQQYSFQYRRSVRRVVLIATTAGWTMIPGRFKALTKMANPRRYQDPDFMLRNFEDLYGDTLDEAGVVHTEHLTPPTSLGYVYQLVAMAGWSSLPFLRFMKQPTLVMMGDNDNIVPLLNGKILAKFAPNARLHVVEKGGHLFIVTKSEESVATILAFLDEDQTASQAA